MQLKQQKTDEIIDADMTKVRDNGVVKDIFIGNYCQSWRHH
jgi:hypothetical protein